jgi:hypothetical protein
MPEFYSYALTRIVTAIGGKGIFIMIFMLAVEITGTK